MTYSKGQAERSSLLEVRIGLSLGFRKALESRRMPKAKCSRKFVVGIILAVTLGNWLANAQDVNSLRGGL
jgi:hypothetical protein